MKSVTEHFIKGSDNQIVLTLIEDDAAISGAWTQLDIWIGDVHIQRAVDGNGVALDPATGVLTITPADLIEDLSELQPGTKRRVQIVVTDATNDDGVVFGGGGSDELLFLISEKPA